MDANLFYAQQRQVLDALYELEEAQQEKRKRDENGPGILALLHDLLLSFWSAIFDRADANADTAF